MRLSHPHYSPILKRSSYYETDYRQSPALIRARRPYIFKNLLTGAVIMTFAVSVCKQPTHRASGIPKSGQVRVGVLTGTETLVAFTIKAVGQEEFADVVVPDAPEGEGRRGVVAQPAKTPNVQVNGIR